MHGLTVCPASSHKHNSPMHLFNSKRCMRQGFFPIVSEVQHGHMWQVCFHVMCPFVRAESGWMLHYSIDHGAITWGDLREMKSAEWCRLALTNCSNIVLG